MRVFTALTYYYPHWTGLTRYAQLIAEGLANRGHHLEVVTSRHAPDLPIREKVNGVHIWRLPVAAQLSRGQISPALPAAFGRAIARSDIAQIHTPFLESGLVAGLCRANSKPLVLTHHGDLVLSRTPFNTLTRSIVVSQMTLAGHSASAVVAYSRDYARHSPFLSQFGEKRVIIPPPVSIPQPDLESVRQWKRELGLEKKRIIGFAGRFVSEKGFDFLLRAMPLIRQQVPEAHFIFAGETGVVYEKFFEECRPLWEENKEHITTLGLLRDQQKLADFYALCDVFTLPSRTDCFALVQAEAMCCGTPVVASNIAGARVAVKETGAGALFPCGDVKALAAAIVEVLQNPERYAPDPAAMRSHFDIEKTIDAYEQLYEQVANRSFKRAVSPPQPAEPVNESPIVAREFDMAFRRRAHRLLEWLKPREGDVVLDCGCGSGFYVKAFTALEPKATIVGLDDEFSRLQRASAETPSAHLLRGDALRLPFKDGAFDKIMLSEVLEHLTDDEAGLRELWRVLKPGGLLGISVPHARYPLQWDPFNRLQTAFGGEPFRDGFPVGIWTFHERLYEPEDLRVLACEANFEIEHLEVATHHSPPLAHFMLYGVGKALIEKGLLPTDLAQQVDRFTQEEKLSGLAALVRNILRVADKPNDKGEEKSQTFVNVLLLARKPYLAA
jgi:glycosyltransferase involved in cell wall biosynthesis/SAM-dependent methyltransferase